MHTSMCKLLETRFAALATHSVRILHGLGYVSSGDAVMGWCTELLKLDIAVGLFIT